MKLCIENYLFIFKLILFQEYTSSYKHLLFIANGRILLIEEQRRFFYIHADSKKLFTQFHILLSIYNSHSEILLFIIDTLFHAYVLNTIAN
jgi:hypothetical protein